MAETIKNMSETNAAKDRYTGGARSYTPTLVLYSSGSEMGAKGPSRRENTATTIPIKRTCP
ncbi:hypothetical protein HS1genome_0240 [Sulfodiicoccus acidiphilus]|uniref:Uncharacterized protein n=1 Tax=Sulfodiicoccus acidiphilus TaxID=1670455 RepID=A0A348B0Z9_9CREN|nr:hypothetical protein HS1genome_0240 [Sulfodiicoccus acidiphilus]GGU02452.1 hypothetical protein GCM10007116_19410 [Sulfodiicoccus acidiphilus]